MKCIQKLLRVIFTIFWKVFYKAVFVFIMLSRVRQGFKDVFGSNEKLDKTGVSKQTIPGKAGRISKGTHQLHGEPLNSLSNKLCSASHPIQFNNRTGFKIGAKPAASVGKTLPTILDVNEDKENANYSERESKCINLTQFESIQSSNPLPVKKNSSLRPQNLVVAPTLQNELNQFQFKRKTSLPSGTSAPEKPFRKSLYDDITNPEPVPTSDKTDSITFEQETKSEQSNMQIPVPKPRVSLQRKHNVEALSLYRNAKNPIPTPRTKLSIMMKTKQETSEENGENTNMESFNFIPPVPKPRSDIIKAKTECDMKSEE